MLLHSLLQLSPLMLKALHFEKMDIESAPILNIMIVLLSIPLHSQELLYLILDLKANPDCHFTWFSSFAPRFIS
jgi:hypothetical protein